LQTIRQNKCCGRAVIWVLTSVPKEIQVCVEQLCSFVGDDYDIGIGHCQVTVKRGRI